MIKSNYIIKPPENGKIRWYKSKKTISAKSSKLKRIKMTHKAKRIYLIKTLLAEKSLYGNIVIPEDEQGQKDLLRSLMNVRLPAPLTDEYIKVESEYLKKEAKEKGITRFSDLKPVKDGLYVRKGDITTLECDAVVNAADPRMLGCFHPLHDCVDNRIHSAAGLSLRNCCSEIMKKQGHDEPPGKAKMTPAFNLPCKYILHTVGPMVNVTFNTAYEEQLASCYRSCLSLAEEYGCKNIAFCSISAEAFGFAQIRAAQTAVKTVTEYRAASGSGIEVIFNVFNDEDQKIYIDLIG